MSVSIVRLGSPRSRDEGVRIGTVRRPPRGVPKTQYAAGDWYDVWLPMLSPSPELVKIALTASSERDFAAFARRFRTEMADPQASRVLDLLAALSHQSNFAIGCYCAAEARCHRAVLRALLSERGAQII